MLLSPISRKCALGRRLLVDAANSSWGLLGAAARAQAASADLPEGRFGYLGGVSSAEYVPGADE